MTKSFERRRPASRKQLPAGSCSEDYEESGVPCPCKGEMPRRDFLAVGAGALVAVSVGRASPAAARGSGESQAFDEWLGSLTDPGSTRVYAGEQLEHVTIPLGGIGAGTVGLSGRGHLGPWEIFNNFNQRATLPYGFFSVRAKAEGAPAVAKMLNLGGAHGKPGIGSIELRGEYPFAWLDYGDEELPVRISLMAYSPFIPLNARDSGLPAAVFRFEVKNSAERSVEASLALSIPNAVGWDGYRPPEGLLHPEFGGNFGTLQRHEGRTTLVLGTRPGRRDRFERSLRWAVSDSDLAFHMRLTDRLTTRNLDYRGGRGLPSAEAELPDVVWNNGLPAGSGDPNVAIDDLRRALEAGRTVVVAGARDHLLRRLDLARPEERKEIVFEDFESGSFKRWKVEGEAFRDPATGTWSNQQRVSGWKGKFFVNSYQEGDAPTGRMASRPFSITLPYIHLLVGGGRHRGRTCVQLRIGERIVRSAAGIDREALRPVTWDVKEFLGKEALLEIVDRHSGGWGHINADHIVFSSSPDSAQLDPRLRKRLLDLLPVTYEATDVVESAGSLEEGGLLEGVERCAAKRPELRLSGMQSRSGSEVWLRDAEGHPLVVSGAAGKGRLVLCLFQPRDMFSGRDAKTFTGRLLGQATGVAYAHSEGWWKTAPGRGTLAMTALTGDASACAGYDDIEAFWQDFSDDGSLEGPEISKPSPAGATEAGALAQSVRLGPGESREMTFLLTWHFPNRFKDRNYGWWDSSQAYRHRLGNMYNNWFSSAGAVSQYVVTHLERLERQSKEFRRAFYDSTLPRYLLDGVTANIAILRSQVSLWLEDGTFAGFEGADRCCPMNCTHVYNYAMSNAFLFPELERRVREIDLLVQQRPDGSIPHRTVLPLTLPRLWGSIGGPHDHALDGMLGTVLKAYRDHRQHGDPGWLARIWARVEKLMDYVIETFDRQGDGVIRGPQPNTYDIHTYGSNTFLGTLYISALRAAAAMAREIRRDEVAERYEKRAALSSSNYDKVCWRDGYYVNVYDAPEAEAATYEAHNCWGPGCHSDQLLGQWWAHVLGIGYVLPSDHVRKACDSMFRHSWRRDLSDHEHRQRVFASGHEKGLLNCSWPRGGRPQRPIRYCDEVWTGIEYAVAALLFYEGKIQEALQIVRGARDRYTGNQRNPWSEVECGNYYARALSSYSLLLSAGGVDYHAGTGRLEFIPRWRPESCSLFFAGAEGWGTLAQERDGTKQTNALEVRHGKIDIRELALEAPSAKPVQVSVRRGKKLNAETEQGGSSLKISFPVPVTIREGETLEVTLEPKIL